MHYSFGRDAWQPADFILAHSPHVQQQYHFLQNDDCIVNFANQERERFAYISMITREKYQPGVTLATTCAFETYGAPLLVIANDYETRNGENIYGVHFEIVAYENGCNVWMIEPDDTQTEKHVRITSIRKEKFPVDADVPLTLEAEILPNAFRIHLNGTHAFEAALPVTLSDFHVGITACEGINRFYDFSVTDRK